MKYYRLHAICIFSFIVFTAGFACASSITWSNQTVKSGKYYKPELSGNCAAYVKSFVSVKGDLSNLASKRKVINTSKCKKGYVAIIQVGSNDRTGHVALVTAVDDDGKNMSIELHEANYPYGTINKRTIKGSKVKKLGELETHFSAYRILGYYKP